MKDFIIQKNAGLKYLTIPSFTKSGVIHGFSTRKVEGREASSCVLDTGSGNQEKEFRAIKNRGKFLGALNLKGEFWSLKQVHGSRIYSVEEIAFSKGDDPLEGDGLVTGHKGVILTMYSADCVIIFLFDPVKRVAALGHAGWRGTLEGIGKELVKAMAVSYGCRSEDILAGISPAVGACCYEVGEEVKEKLSEKVKDPYYYTKPTAGGKWMLDLKLLNVRLLNNAGIREENVTVSSFCTFCNGDLFFSYRRDGGFAGRMMSVICLPE